MKTSAFINNCSFIFMPTVEQKHLQRGLKVVVHSTFLF